MLRQITHAAIPPNKASNTRETTVMVADVPNALQKLKLELLTTFEIFVLNCAKLAPAKLTGFATIPFAFLNVLISTR